MRPCWRLELWYVREKCSLKNIRRSFGNFIVADGDAPENSLREGLNLKIYSQKI